MSLVSCTGCQERDREIARLRHKIGELEQDKQRLGEELAAARRESNRQAAPFRREELKKRKKKPGRRKGHPAANRPTPPPERIDRVVEVPCRTCPDCATELVERDTVVQYQTDLPPIVPIVTQFQIETGYCPCCRRRHQGRHPEQTSDAIGAAGNTLGPVVLTMAAELKHRLGVPYRKICDFLQTYCDMKVSSGALIRAEQRLADLARPTYDLLIDALRKSDVVHIDETGWRIKSVNGCQQRFKKWPLWRCGPGPSAAVGSR
jgi:transposase